MARASKKSSPSKKKLTAKKPVRADKSEPAGLRVGLPHVPSLYGLKPRKQYLPWSHARERLERSRNYWICTARPDGRPHSIPVWGFFVDDVLYFGTAKLSRKAKNLSHNPAVSIHLDSGDDVVIVEGKAVEVSVSEKPVIAKLDAASKKKYKMPLMIMPESVLYAVRPRVVLSWTEKEFPNNATRWEFGWGI
jgi:nitroimidazol reductase NimA-like FMN-containing flavoprotein (pyridoxamine 5'-phosphate oxidase superfamily)